MDESTHNINNFSEEQPDKGPLKLILGIALIIIVLVAFIPQLVQIDIEPKNIPNKEILNNRSIREIAAKISSDSCPSDRVCQAKAIYYFVQNNIDYISDPVDQEYIEEPLEFLSVGGGDCESGSITMAAMMEAIGIDAELVVVPKHAIIRIWLPEARKLLQKDSWVYLDWTCKSCRFGETHVSDIQNIYKLEFNTKTDGTI